jgi:hypothetical protein
VLRAREKLLLVLMARELEEVAMGSSNPNRVSATFSAERTPSASADTSLPFSSPLQHINQPEARLAFNNLPTTDIFHCTSIP